MKNQQLIQIQQEEIKKLEANIVHFYSQLRHMTEEALSSNNINSLELSLLQRLLKQYTVFFDIKTDTHGKIQ